MIAWETLQELIGIVGPAGDEEAIADDLTKRVSPGIPGATVTRIGDDLIVVRGKPQTAIFAHTDTIGWTLGYDRSLIPIGGPRGCDGDKLRTADGTTGLLRLVENKPTLRRVRDSAGKKTDATPGSRWVYGRKPKIAKGVIATPYLDDRAGVWSALEALGRCENIAVAFCTGEEQHGHGARVCGDFLVREYGIRQALIADITWHTKDTPCGKGVAISLRDAFCPRQAFLDRVLALATESGIAYQREIQSAGSSDGGHLLRSSLPIDWVFVGAPSKAPHTSREKATLTDLEAMADLLVYLVDKL
jgi:putative aminopeptidase FrvX